MRLLKFILRLLTPWTWFGWKLASEPVPAPVQMKSSETSKASTQNVEPSAPVPSGTTLSPAPVQPLKTRPPATEQTQALLELLHRDYAGFKVRAVDVEKISYLQLVKAAGWRAQPWDGKNGVGAHFGRLKAVGTDDRAGGSPAYGSWSRGANRPLPHAGGTTLPIECNDGARSRGGQRREKINSRSFLATRHANSRAVYVSRWPSTMGWPSR
jgi:hypothetical protein